MVAGAFGVRNRESDPLRQRFFQIYTTRRAIVPTQRLVSRTLASKLIRDRVRETFVWLVAVTIAIKWLLQIALPLVLFILFVWMVGGGLWPTCFLIPLSAVTFTATNVVALVQKRGVRIAIAPILYAAGVATALPALVIFVSAVWSVYSALANFFWPGLVFTLIALVFWELKAAILWATKWIMQVGKAMAEHNFIGTVAVNAKHVIFTHDVITRVEGPGFYTKYPDQQVVAISNVPVLLTIEIGGDSGIEMVTANGSRVQGSVTMELTPDNCRVLAAHEIVEGPEDYRSKEAIDGVEYSKRLLMRSVVELLNRKVRAVKDDAIAEGDTSENMEREIASDLREAEVDQASAYAWLLGIEGIGLAPTERRLLKLRGFSIGTVEIDLNVDSKSPTFVAREKAAAAVHDATAEIARKRGLGEANKAYVDAAGVDMEKYSPTTGEVLDIELALTGQTQVQRTDATKTVKVPSLDTLVDLAGPAIVKKFFSDNDDKKD